MRNRYILFSLILMLGGLVGIVNAAPKLDPELTARISTTSSTRQLGVILTFHGSQVTERHK